MRRFCLPLTCIVLLLLKGCVTEDTGPIGVSPAAIHDDPAAYYGSRVTVSGEVDDVYSPGTFTIGGDEFGEEILVLSMDSVAVATGRSGERPVRRTDIVQVSGVVLPLAEIDTTDHYGFDPAVLADPYGDGPVVVARSAGTRLDHIIVTARSSEVAPPAEGQLLTDFGRAAGDDGRDLMGRPAHFSGVTSAEIIGENSFWGTVREDSLFVVLVGGAMGEDLSVEDMEDQTWELYGILREVPPSAELTSVWGLTEEVAAPLARQSVFLQAIRARPSGPLSAAPR